MGKLGRAIGAGFTAAGQQMMQYAAQQEEKKRYEEQLAMDKEKMEADMAESKIRQDRMKLENDMKKSIYNSEKIRQTYIGTGGDPNETEKAFSKYGGWYQSRFDEERSSQATAAAGDGKERIVIQFGTLATDENDDPRPDKYGKPEFIPNKGTTRFVTYTREEYDNRVANMMNPDSFLATLQKGYTQQELREKNDIMQQARVKAAQALEEHTKTGAANVRKAEADAGLSEKKLEEFGKVDPNDPNRPPEHIGVDGKKHKRSRQEADGDIAAMKIMNERNPEWGVTSPGEAFRVNQVKNNPDMRKALANDIEKAAKNPNYGEKLVKEGSKKFGLPEAFLREMVAKAEADIEKIEKSKGGLGAWIKRFLNSDKEAPKGYDNVGGLGGS
jgi:hypothetical protein